MADYRTLRDFRAFEIVNAMRLSLALDSFRTLALFGSIAVVALGTLVFVSAMSVLRDSSLRNTAGALELGLLAVFYLAAVVTVSETISSRRLAVAGSPHLELFRAMELPFQQVVVRYGLIPVLRRTGLVWYVAAMFFIIFFEASPHYLGITVIAVSVLTLCSSACLYSTLRFASAPARRAGLRWQLCLLTLLLGIAVGVATGLLWPRFGSAAHVQADAQELLPLMCSIALVGSGLFIMRGIRMWRTLAYRKILLGTGERSPQRKQGAGLTAFVVSDLVSSRHGSVISTIILAWIAVVGILLGARDVLPLHSSVNGEDLHRSLIGISLILSLGVSEPVLYRIGPSAKLYHFRFAWENGTSSTSIVSRLMGVYLVSGGVIGAFLFCGAFLALGIVAPGTVIVGVTVMAAGIIAETLARPGTSTDGTKSNDVMDALCTLLLISPCSLVLVLSPANSAILLLGYAMLLTLGAAVCLRTRLLNLRLRLTL